jgi:hypothetical protein
MPGIGTGERKLYHLNAIVPPETEGARAMSNVIPFRSARNRSSDERGYPIIEKIVDGERIECVNVDLLTPAQFSRYFSEEKN